VQLGMIQDGCENVRERLGNLRAKTSGKDVRELSNLHGAHYTPLGKDGDKPLDSSW